jgi:hypothetical protein
MKKNPKTIKQKKDFFFFLLNDKKNRAKMNKKKI